MYKKKYFNFPISFLKSFNFQSDGFFNDVWDYCIYKQSKNYSGERKERIDRAKDYFDISGGGSNKEIYDKGWSLEYEVPIKTATVGMTTTMWFDFYKNDKSEFEKVCLLAYLGLKSLVGTKAWSKSNYKLLFSRMSGYTKCLADSNKINPHLLKYYTRRYKAKIIEELQNNWYLKYYSYHTRGFYFSLDISRKELIIQAEKNRPSTKEAKRKRQDKRIRDAIMQGKLDECINDTQTDHLLHKVG